MLAQSYSMEMSGTGRRRLSGKESGVLLEKHQVSAEGPPRMGCVPSARLSSPLPHPQAILYLVLGPGS